MIHNPHAPATLGEYLHNITTARLKMALRSMPLETLMNLSTVLSGVIEEVYVASYPQHLRPHDVYREPSIRKRGNEPEQPVKAS